MKYNIFPYPFWLREIEVNKIKLDCKSYENHFPSKTKSSFSSINTTNNQLHFESAAYLLNIFKSFLEDFEIEKIF